MGSSLVAKTSFIGFGEGSGLRHGLRTRDDHRAPNSWLHNYMFLNQISIYLYIFDIGNQIVSCIDKLRFSDRSEKYICTNQLVLHKYMCTTFSGNRNCYMRPVGREFQNNSKCGPSEKGPPASGV